MENPMERLAEFDFATVAVQNMTRDADGPWLKAKLEILKDRVMETPKNGEGGER